MKLKQIFMIVFFPCFVAGMDHIIDSDEEWDEPAIMRSMRVDKSEVWLPKLKSKTGSQLQQEYYQFFSHITHRVEVIERELEKFIDDTQPHWIKQFSSAWSAVKSYTRSLEMRLKDPESEQQAQKLIVQIAGKKNKGEIREILLNQGNRWIWLHVQSKIADLCENYQAVGSSFIETQLGYLKEYQERIARVEKEWK